MIETINPTIFREGSGFLGYKNNPTYTSAEMNGVCFFLNLFFAAGWRFKGWKKSNDKIQVIQAVTFFNPLVEGHVALERVT